MGTLFLILFIIAEITLVVLTFTKYGKKADWLKNRMIVRAAETILLLGIVLIPATHLKWRFMAALLIVCVRFVFAGIRWFVKRKNELGSKKKGWSVVNCVFSVVLIIVSLTPAFVFTNYNGLENTGEFQVMESSAILVDESRADEFENDGSFREVPVHFYYPDAEGTFPLVVFSHGAFGYYQSNYSTYTELASNGYVVAALDHPHHAFFTEDTEGNTVIVDSQFITEAIDVTNGVKTTEEVFEISREWMELRTDDVNFVLDTIEEAKESGELNDAWHTENADEAAAVLSITDVDKIGLMGHSMGGATSAAVGRERSDIDAVAVLDGTMLGENIAVNGDVYEFNNEPYPVPVLDFTKKSDYDEFEKLKKETGYVYTNEYVISNALDGKTVVFKDVEHMDFTDLPLISPFLSSMLGKKVYETKQKIYELDEILKEKYFLRISKSMLLNLMKLSSIKPGLNGRFTAVLQTGEEVIISRKYVPELKKALKGGVS